ncbi:hypothetical protein EJ110_NYTH34661 [Nymphaea thermarum]|nr:hypothetical protein EJ110_NYTH34661 [Nymphaea thermarum]
MAEDLFSDLPPPSAILKRNIDESTIDGTLTKKDSAAHLNPPPPPVQRILKGALKKQKPSESSQEQAPQKRLRFKTTVDASETQIIEAMQKIAAHIRNPSKFGKASKLALQLVQAGSVKPGTADQFFSILEAAMSTTTACTDPSLRADYSLLFSSVQDIAKFFNTQQKNQLTTWTLRAVVANDLNTDDSFVFSKAAGRVKEAISSLPFASEEDDIEEATALTSANRQEETMEDEGVGKASKNDEIETMQEDPFGLDELLPSGTKRVEKRKEKKDAMVRVKKAEDEHKRFLTAQREALILCLDIAARRYKTPWAQTVIDILVKHAFDNIGRFTAQQRDAIEKLWTSIREQMTHRKQGKSVTGKLDMNAFEMLQEKYANEKISIRHAVGGGGDRRAEQWLG